MLRAQTGATGAGLKLGPLHWLSSNFRDEDPLPGNVLVNFLTPPALGRVLQIAR